MGFICSVDAECSGLSAVTYDHEVAQIIRYSVARSSQVRVLRVVGSVSIEEVLGRALSRITRDVVLAPSDCKCLFVSFLVKCRSSRP